MTKGKKIAIIAVSFVILAVIIAVITLAIVQSTFYSPALDNVKSLTIYVDGTALSVGECSNREIFGNIEGNKGQEIFDGVMDANKTSSNESVLTCLFAGTYSFKHKHAMRETELADIKAEGYVIEYKFTETQTLVIDGEEKKDTDGNKIKYDSMYIEVKDTTDLTETYAYLYNNKDTDSEVRISFLARQHKLYDYIAELAE